MTPPPAASAGTLRRPIAPRAPRRLSGPTRPSARLGTSTGHVVVGDPFALRALRRARALSDSRLLDRLVRGRLWIPVVATGLMGIVFMQVTMLKLNAGIGRAVETSATIERQNAIMRADVSRLESGDRVDQVATRLGMVQPADGSTHFARAAAVDPALAAERMTAPSPVAATTTTTATVAPVAPVTAVATTTPVTASAAPASTVAATTATAPPTTASAPATTTQPATVVPATASSPGAAAAPAGGTGSAGTSPVVAPAPAPAAAATAGAMVAPR